MAVEASTVAVATSAMHFTVFGSTINIMALALIIVVFGILLLFYRIQASEKLDFADLITKNGTSVSLTKVLQLIGGITGTWTVIKLTIAGTLSEAIFGLYLTYVGAVEGYSKYVAAKYGYEEKSVKTAAKKEE